MDFVTKKLGAWAELHGFSKHGWLYRGQRSADWSLETSFERCANRQGFSRARRHQVETELMREFRRSYHHYATPVPEVNAPIEWLSIMQHHGAPTRLLDVSYSIYVAAYFALEHADGESAIWAINGPWALNASAKILRKTSGKTDYVAEFMGPFTEKTEATMEKLFFKKPSVNFVAPVNPFRLNQRLRVQKGAFLCPGTVDVPFLKNLKAMKGWDKEANVVKIVIPSGMRRNGLEQLNSMNVNSMTLFPGLDGFAQSLGVYHIAFNPVKWTKGT